MNYWAKKAASARHVNIPTHPIFSSCRVNIPKRARMLKKKNIYIYMEASSGTNNPDDTRQDVLTQAVRRSVANAVARASDARDSADPRTSSMNYSMNHHDLGSVGHDQLAESSGLTSTWHALPTKWEDDSPSYLQTSIQPSALFMGALALSVMLIFAVGCMCIAIRRRDAQSARSQSAGVVPRATAAQITPAPLQARAPAAVSNAPGLVSQARSTAWWQRLLPLGSTPPGSQLQQPGRP